ncbi:MAG TPA: NAD(P)-binding protein [Candidatus Angelobacter sp.]|nr:NAD(P)-binding protein [Candidatus Angelobacter sp.]
MGDSGKRDQDRELGMGRHITRRDFLNGVSVGVGGAMLASQAKLLAALEGASFDHESFSQGSKGYYPPALTGLRGSYDATYQYAHQLRDGAFWDAAPQPSAISESYDLVVVGGGISGLAAAYFYRQKAGKNARILILDNHDDFGGHAKRNEFTAGGRMVLSYGGTQSIESPGEYSKVAKGLLKDLGIDTSVFYKAYDRKLYSKLGTAVFFDKETFGQDRLIPGMSQKPWPEFLAQAPMSETAKRDIARVFTEHVDYLPGMTREQKRKKLEHISYADFLTKYCQMTPEALPFFQTYPQDLFGLGIDAVSAMDCFEAGDDYAAFRYPGFEGMDLGHEEKEEPYIFHFPDGNASIARLLVRAMIPAVMPGHDMFDVVTARADYGQLDRADSPVRIRLNSTAVKVKHDGPPASAKQVNVLYMQDGKLQGVRAGHVVMACYNSMVPYLCPELPAKQQEALKYGAKVPLVYTHVAINSWEAFSQLGTQIIVSPGSYHSVTALDFPVSLGAYKFPSKPSEPAVLFMLRTPCKPGLPARDQYRYGRMELYQTPYATFERNIRDQLGRMLGGAGFDPARDIDGITVNRWSHGYAYEYTTLWDPDFPPNERPCVIGRQPFGRITIANSDAGAKAYTDVAIDQAWRAVGEIQS